MKKPLILLCALVSAALFSCGKGEVPYYSNSSDPVRQTQCLNENWTFNQSGKTEILPATVPGVVHTDLLGAGIIPDPFASTNEPKLQWIEHQTWIYTSTFTPSETILNNAVQELVFKGLDTYADVYLNDELILEGTDNMFIEWRVPVAGKLKPNQENTLKVVFHPAYEVGEKLAQAWPVKLPADNDKGEWKTSVFTRKAPYHFGWDWGPRYVTAGIWRPVYLESYQTARISDIQYVQKTQTEAAAEFEAIVTLDNVTPGTETKLSLTGPDNLLYASEKITLTTQEQTTVRIPFTIENPKLWWPNGIGEPNLYTLTAYLTEDEKGLLDKNTQRIGVRTVRLVQEPDEEGEGVSFYFEVNGHPVFAKGANYIPQDNFLPRVDSSRYQELIRGAVESNMNMLRIWGGGIYEEDLFYELCNENGIMVWQDFMFACSFYPWDSDFLDNVKKEAVYNVRRLRNHPSVVIWCGNNEIDEAWYHWGYQGVYGWNDEEQAAIKHGIDTLFRGVLADVTAREDPSRYYHPSSPLYGRGNPKSQIMGDVHYWGVFHDEEPFSVYKDKPGRFSNEYGFESLATYDTYREYFTPADMRIYSPAMVIHQKSPKGYRVIEEYMVRDLPLLKDDFQTYVYLTQILQAEGIRIAMEGQRSKRPWTMGSLYWQYNDCWPVASWSSMDSRYRWKALQYQARRSFAPVALAFEKIDSTQMASLWVLNDKLEDLDGEGTYRLYDFEGNMRWTRNILLDVKANSSLRISHTMERFLLEKYDPQTHFLVAEGTVGGEPVRAIYYFLPFKDLKLPEPEYDVTYQRTGDRSVEATITAKNLLKSVLFEAKALQDNPSDAYFDMIPGEKRVITLNFSEPIPSGNLDDLGISVRTLNQLVGRPSQKPITRNVE